MHIAIYACIHIHKSMYTYECIYSYTKIAYLLHLPLAHDHKCHSLTKGFSSFVFGSKCGFSWHKLILCLRILPG